MGGKVTLSIGAHVTITSNRQKRAYRSQQAAKNACFSFLAKKDGGNAQTRLWTFRNPLPMFNFLTES